jgi:D-amino-acid dehydrogenase
VRVLVLGAGVIGVTTAYYLAQVGHEVTVVDRQPGAGLEASFANAGNVCPGYATPWAAPGMRAKALRWMLAEHAPLKLNFRADPALLGWMVRWLRECKPERFRLNKARMQHLSYYSLRCLQGLRREVGLAYDRSTDGILQLLRTGAEVEAVQSHLPVLAASGIPHRLVDARGCVTLEPALEFARTPFAGGLHLPGDETGDCYQFTQALAEHASARGVRFRFETGVEEVRVEGDRVAGIGTVQGVLTAERYVVAMGHESARLLAPLGIRLPIQPVKGYSVTLPITAFDHAPRGSVMDERSKIAITRLGNRIRAAGTAELGASGVDTPPERFETLLDTLRTLFPEAADETRADFWAGMRPMTPDGPPVLGATPLANLFLNVGHGSQGWSMACGSARVVAQLVSGKDPGLDIDGLTIERYA